MDYRSQIKEKMGKLLFLEMNIEGFKESINIPKNVKFKNKDLYLPISTEYISSNIENEIKIKNLPIYYFIEGMFIAFGCDENLRFNDDYELILDYIKDTENCIKSLISKGVNEEKYLEAYILLKGYYYYSKDNEVLKKLLLVGENIREKDKEFGEVLLDDIEYCEKNKIKINDYHLYKALILKDNGEFEKSKIELNEYINKGGNITEEIKVLTKDIDNITKYEKAIEMLNEVPEKSLQSLLELVEEFDSNPLIYYYIGVAFRRLQKFEEAIHYLRESIKIESGILEVVVELGLNYACLGEYEEALIYFKKAFEASRDVEICTNIIMCYINLKDMKSAKLHLAIAKELNSEDEIVKEIENLISK